MSRAVSAAVLVALAACGTSSRHVAWPDLPPALADEADRAQAIDELAALPAGPARHAARGAVAEALAARLTDAVEDGRGVDAARDLATLAALWQDDPDVAGGDLARHVAVLRRLRSTFASSGNLEATVLALTLLAEAEPAARAQHLGELDEVLAFADELAVAEHGPHALRAQPIVVLRGPVMALPLPWLVDRYVGLLEARQAEVVATIATEGATMDIVRAHHDLLATARRIAGALTRAGRVDELFGHLARLRTRGGEGLGSDRTLTARAEAVADQPTPDAYVELAAALRGGDEGGDPTAALATCARGLARFPADPTLLEAAAEHAAAAGRIERGLAYGRAAAARRGAQLDATAIRRVGQLWSERIARLAFGGRPSAALAAWRELAGYAGGRPPARDATAWPVAAALGRVALGRGLLSQGLVDAGGEALAAAIGLAPSPETYEALAHRALQLDQLDDARRWATAGLTFVGDAPAARYHRAKLARLAGDAARRAGHVKDAGEHYLAALRDWADLGDAGELPRPLVGERLIESGKAMWYLGDRERAVDLELSAVDLDADTPATAAGAVAFLLLVDRPAEARDAVHMALGAPKINEYYKIYLALWLLADAHRRGEPADRRVTEYLASRRGDLWYEALAEVAAGHRTLASLGPLATTRPRQAELAYYTAALGLAPQASSAERRAGLAAIIEAGLIMDAEYDFARRDLGR